VGGSRQSACLEIPDIQQEPIIMSSLKVNFAVGHKPYNRDQSGDHYCGFGANAKFSQCDGHDNSNNSEANSQRQDVAGEKLLNPVAKLWQVCSGFHKRFPIDGALPWMFLSHLIGIYIGIRMVLLAMQQTGLAG
jgi:hypothetical protein